MKRSILCILSIVLSLHIGGNVYAAETTTLSNPILIAASGKIHTAIQEKYANPKTAMGTRLELTEQQKQLDATLESVEQAIKTKNKILFNRSLSQFRSQYFALKELLAREEKPISTTITTGSIQGGLEKPANILYYSDSFEWSSTSNGNNFSQSYFSSARCDTPFNALIQVINEKKSVIVKNNDRPNCVAHPDIVDITRSAFSAIGKVSRGKLSGSVVSLGSTSKDYYKRYLDPKAFVDLGIQLNTNIPNTYLQNETLHIVGSELLGKSNTLLDIRAPSGKKITLLQEKNTDNTFEYAYPLMETGTYRLVLTSGNSYNTVKYADIVVFDPAIFATKKLFPGNVAPPRLTSLNSERVEFSDMKAVYVLRFPTNNFYTLSLKQGDNNVQYSGMGIIAIPSDALIKFDEAKLMSVSVTMSHSSTSFSHDTYTTPEMVFSDTMMPRAGYRTEKKENITTSVDKNHLIVHGVIAAGEKVHPEIVLTLPDGNVQKYTLDGDDVDADKYLKRGVIFKKIIPLNAYGQYLVELNNDSGLAAYNGPAIYGPILPVLPSEYDLTDKSISWNAETIRLRSLEFINTLRLKAGKKTISLDDTLTNLATIKATDMADHAYFGHRDSRGYDILGTAKHNGIKVKWSVGENVAGGTLGAETLLIGLINSGGHRANMLGSWTKVGIGYVVRDGKVYYVQVFGG